MSENKTSRGQILKQRAEQRRPSEHDFQENHRGKQDPSAGDEDLQPKDPDQPPGKKEFRIGAQQPVNGLFS
jgi:hypothetical protein